MLEKGSRSIWIASSCFFLLVVLLFFSPWDWEVDGRLCSCFFFVCLQVDFMETCHFTWLFNAQLRQQILRLKSQENNYHRESMLRTWGAFWVYTFFGSRRNSFWGFNFNPGTESIIRRKTGFVFRSIVASFLTCAPSYLSNIVLMLPLSPTAWWPLSPRRCLNHIIQMARPCLKNLEKRMLKD